MDKKTGKTLALLRSLTSLRNRGIWARGFKNVSLQSTDCKVRESTYDRNDLRHVVVVLEEALVN